MRYNTQTLLSSSTERSDEPRCDQRSRFRRHPLELIEKTVSEPNRTHQPPPPPKLTRGQIDRVIMMAWEDRTSFDAIQIQFGLSPGDVIKLMRREMKPSSFKMWRKRTRGRTTKHEAMFAKTHSGDPPRRFRAKSQRG